MQVGEYFFTDSTRYDMIPFPHKTQNDSQSRGVHVYMYPFPSPFIRIWSPPTHLYKPIYESMHIWPEFKFDPFQFYVVRIVLSTLVVEFLLNFYCLIWSGGGGGD